jgi:hypothetical protein
MSTVFISNKSDAHDYSPASKFGAIRFVTSGNYPVFKTTRLQEEAIEALIYSKPSDYLLLSGSSLIAAVCLTVWLEMHGEAKILLWDRANDGYEERIITKKGVRLAIEEARDQLGEAQLKTGT